MNLLKEPNGELRNLNNFELFGYWFEVDDIVYYINIKDTDGTKN